MAIYTEKVKDKTTGKMVDKKADGKTQYYIRTYVTDEFGKKKQITRHNKEWLGRDGYWKAQQEENRLKNKIVRINNCILFKNLFKDFLQEILKINKESTYVTYETCINSQFQSWYYKDITKVTMCDFENWHQELEDKKLSLKYKNKCHTIMNSILSYAMKKQYIEQNYEKILGSFKQTREEKEKIIKDEEKLRYITYEQFQKLISCIDSTYWYTIINFFYFTGMRKGEIQALTWEDIDFTNKRIRIIKTLTKKTKDEKGYRITSTKGIENRVIDMDKNLCGILIKYKQSLDYTPDEYFIFGNEKPLPQTTIDHNLKKWFKKAHMDDFIITPHEFRHSHVSLLISEYIRKGYTDTTKFFLIVGKRMGHTLEVMQKVYLHLFPNVQKEVIDLLENL